jgi:polar amino acid transport system substrate-binding protein
MLRTLLRLVVGLMLGLTLIGAGSAETVLERAKREGVIRVGFPNQVPYAYANEKGVLTGADAEFAKLVVEKMGIPQMEGVLTEFAALIPGLKAKRFDIVLAMFVTPQRCEQVAFSEPIYGIGQALIVAKDNPLKLKDFGQLVSDDKLRIAVMAGAVQASYLKKLGVSSDRVAVLPDMLSAANAIKGGRVDVFPISALPARRLVASMGADAGVEVVEGFPDPVVDGKPARGYGAFAFRKEDEDLLMAFNTALASIEGTDKHLTAIAPFGFDKSNLPDKTTAELCK